MKELRLLAGYLTQESLAEKLCVDRSTVAKWESGVAYPRFEMLQQLSILFSCSIDEIARSLSKNSAGNKTA